MKKQGKVLLIIVLAVVIGVCLYVMRLKGNLLINSDDNLEIPLNCKAAIVYSTGRNQAERTVILYYDENGDMLGKQLFASASAKQAIEGCDGHFNFFTNEQIYFSDGHSVNNNEMKKEYRFASDDGYDTVSYSGYIKNWGMYYKSIPHGLAYDISELGYFDILTLYNEKEVKNFRTSNLPVVAVKEDEEETAVYCFNDHTDFDLEKTDPNIIFYEKIIRDGAEFQIKTGQIDISKATYKEELSITNAIWDGDDLYMMVDREEDSLHRYMYHFLKEGDDVRFINSIHLDWKQIGLKEDGYDVYTQTIPFLRDGVIEYHQYCSENTAPGIICYDIKNETFSFIKYDKYDEDADSEYRTINGTLYYLEQDAMEQSNYNIFTVDKVNTYNHVITVKTTARNLSNMFLVDFYVFE